MAGKFGIISTIAQLRWGCAISLWPIVCFQESGDAILSQQPVRVSRVANGYIDNGLQKVDSMLMGMIRLFLAIAISSVTVVNWAYAQEATRAPVVMKLIEDADQTIKGLVEVISLPSTDDQTLVDARLKLENLKNEFLTVEGLTRKRLAELSARLEQLGPEPEQGSTISEITVSEQWKTLNLEKSFEIVTLNQINEIKSAINTHIKVIAEKRRNAFVNSLYKRNPVSAFLFKSAQLQYSFTYAALSELVVPWLSDVATSRLLEVIASTILALFLALYFSVIFGRLFKDLYQRDLSNPKPQFFSKISTGFWSTLVPGFAIIVFLGATYVLYEYFGILTPEISKLVAPMFMAIAGVSLAYNLSNAVFYPKSLNWRLISVDDKTAGYLFWLTVAMAVVYGVDYFVTSIHNMANAGLNLTIVRSLITSTIMGIMLLLISLVSAKVQIFQHESGRIQSPNWISYLLALTGLVIIATGLSGYIGLARFMVQQVVVTGAVVAAMFVGFAVGRQIGSEGIIVQSAVGKRLHQHWGIANETIEQFSILAGLLFMAGVLLAGIPLILLQWGSAPSDISVWYGKLLSGFEVGAIRISLSGILIGLGTFFIGLLLTRMFQRWLGSSVLPRTRADSGVQHSIKAGAGYVGIGLAILLAITNAGLDLSSLAIIAGALSLGIGFGLQNIVSNFVSGLILLAERPIKVGDWIVLGSDTSGFVKKISVRATEIETFNKQSIIIPNSELINGKVGNWTHKSKMGRIDIPVGVAYGSDMRLVEKVLLAAADSCSVPMQSPPPFVFFEGFADSSVNLQLRVHLRDILQTPVATKEIAYAIVDGFKLNNIEIPFPQRDLHLRSSDIPTFKADNSGDQ